MSSTQPITAERLTELLFARFYAKETKSFLRINAEVLVKHYPALAAVFVRILENDTSAAGWHRAMNFIDDQFSYISVQNVYDPHVPSSRQKTREATPEEVRVNAMDVWSKDALNELMENWALTNAHYETGYAPHASGEPLEIYCHKYHGALFAHRITDFNMVLTDEYWRGLVAFSLIKDWGKLPAETLSFISWAGNQKNLKAVAELSNERGTVDPEVLAPLLVLKEAATPAVAEGVL